MINRPNSNRVLNLIFLYIAKMIEKGYPFSGASILTRIIHERLLQRPILARRGFSFSLLDGPQGIAVSRNGRLTKTRPPYYLAGVHTRDAPYSARRGPRRRAQTWRALFIAPCAL